ncbi:hypothetical protein FOA52_003218 [Chlamydomonas sp. UWO 241]|nr:hypothetical protein FOA52_003218 [Chlamydomonas sp. UWO 241]
MAAAPDRKLEQWFYTDWTRAPWFKAQAQARARAQQAADVSQPASEVDASASANDAGASASEASTSACTSVATGSSGSTEPHDRADLLSRPPSEDLLRPSYETPTPSFWSLDNPIVAAGALIAALGAVSSVAGRLAGAVPQ